MFTLVQGLTAEVWHLAFPFGNALGFFKRDVGSVSHIDSSNLIQNRCYRKP